LRYENGGDEVYMPKIMVVDDEQDIREMINLMMQKEGFETEMAENGEDFLEKVETFDPDIVTLDVMMPGLTTKDVLDKLNNKKTNPKIIMLTVIRFSDDEKAKIFELGNVVEYITKPFEFDVLVDSIKKHLNPA